MKKENTMQDDTSENDLRERLSIIERMIAEGRRTTESWGWTFVLWGIAFYIALAWSAWGHSSWAWPATMSIAVILTVVVGASRTGNHPQTTLARAIGSIWIALGISIFLLFLALGLSGRLTDPRLFVAVMSALLGMANGACGLVLRWKIQLACAVAWWLTVVAACFGSNAQSMIAFLVAIFLCQIVFGIYGVIAKYERANGAV
jgi:hypothetical protein